MELAGVFDPFGQYIGKVNTDLSWEFLVVFKDNEGKHFIKFLNTGDFPLLLIKFEAVKDEKIREKEIEKFLTEGTSEIGLNQKYKPILNEFYFAPFLSDTFKDLKEKYISFQEFPNGKLFIEKKDNLQDKIIATVFPNNEFYVGSPSFVYENNRDSFDIKGKTILEIKNIINWLVNNLYLEEAKEIINRIKASNVSLDEYRHPKNLCVIDGSDNLLDLQLNRIEAIEFIQSRTKYLHLKLFER